MRLKKSSVFIRAVDRQDVSKGEWLNSCIWNPFLTLLNRICLAYNKSNSLNRKNLFCFYQFEIFFHNTIVLHRGYLGKYSIRIAKSFLHQDVATMNLYDLKSTPNSLPKSKKQLIQNEGFQSR